MNNPIYAWALSFITSVAPADQPQFAKDAKESVGDGQARRESIAKDVVDVVYADPAPPLFAGPKGRGQTVPVILSIMSHESSFRRDVDFGIGPLSKGDGGKSWCLMQNQIGGARTPAWNTKLHRFAYPSDPIEDVVQGWTGKELVEDRKKCITAGLRVVRASFAGTSGLPVLERLRIYASGKADAGSSASQKRMGTAVKWYASHVAPLNDNDAIDLLFPPALPDPTPEITTITTIGANDNAFMKVLHSPRWTLAGLDSIEDL